MSVYGIVDGIFVSNFAGKEAFTALNFIYPVIMIFSSVGFMFGSGGSALISKIFGEGNKEKANKISEQIDKLYEEQRALQVEATKKIIQTFIKNKNFNKVCLTFSYDQMHNPIEKNKPIFMEIACLGDYLRFQIIKEFEEFICDYLPGKDYHFQIEIDDFVIIDNGVVTIDPDTDEKKELLRNALEELLK